MSNLSTALAEAAENFVQAILQAIRLAPLTEVSDLSDEPVRVSDRTPASRVAHGRPGRPAKALAPARTVARPVAAAKRGPTGRRQRATAEEVEQLKQAALATARELPAGFSKGDAMKRSGSTADLGRALGLLVADGVLIRKGERRNARYWVK